MCDKCAEIDAKIARLQNLAHRMFDAQTLKGIDDLIAELEAEKAALHPE